MNYKVLTPPGNVLTLDEVRTHLRLDDVGGVHPHDALIMSQLGAARAFAQQVTGRAVGRQTIELALDAFPAGGVRGILLPLTPVASITSLTYLDANGASQTLSSGLYSLDDYNEYQAWLRPAVGVTWPTAMSMANAVKVRYEAGAADLSPEWRAGILLVVAHLYRNAQEATDTEVHSIPMGAKSFFRVGKDWGV